MHCTDWQHHIAAASRPGLSHKQPAHNANGQQDLSAVVLGGLETGRRPVLAGKAVGLLGTALPAGSNSVGKAAGQPRTALPAGSSLDGRAASRASRAAAKGPAFIRIGDDKPRAAPPVAPTFFAPSQQGQTQPQIRRISAQTPASSSARHMQGAGNLSTAAQTQLAVAITGTPHIDPAVSSPAMTPALAPSALGPVPASNAAVAAATNMHDAPHTAAKAAAHSVEIQAPTHKQASDIQQHDRAQPAAEVPAASEAQVAQLAGTKHNITADIPHLAEAALPSEAAVAAVTPGSATHTPAGGVDASAAQQSGAEDVVAAAAPTVAVTPDTAVEPDTDLQVSRTEPVLSAPRTLLPTSRRQRKGPKAAKPEEPVKTQSSWQELLGLSEKADLKTSAHTSLSGDDASGPGSATELV